MAWSQLSSRAPAMMSTCMDEIVEKVWSSMWRFIADLSCRSESLLCGAAVCHRAQHGVTRSWSSQVCTSPVTLAEWQQGANGCRYARIPEHLLRVTLFFFAVTSPPSDSSAKQLFQFLPPNLHLIDGFFFFLPGADEWFMLWEVCLAAFKPALAKLCDCEAAEVFWSFLASTHAHTDIKR